ncbi:dTMP kinase [Nesterenkonia sp. MY13]|uniref:Thymidylate kinase n=1 Tax=Nesterenkonia sedimenti TaxID=1463632 RepID=A0A7X8TKL5_9MICC|nr:dTMP kinase [Nesterenkonia sedimenti]NLS10413.1 dTMP kinase [Nesterenkonia sedimenti]
MSHKDHQQSHRGLFIVLEGGEGAGKTTQLKLLGEWFTQTGHEVISTREPGGTEIGERIRALVLEHDQGEVDPRTEALLFAASRAAHVTQKISPALASGTVVLCDRYVDSSLAYQGAGRGLGVEGVAEINDWATEGLKPDLTVLLDVDPALSAQRRAARDAGAAGDRIESADLEFHTTLRQAFLDRAAAAPERYLVLDATETPEQIHRRITERLAPLLDSEEVAG